ncbi:MAG: hypothetical protein KYX62_00340 [Pseudomonadota bacterium]|nr:hypothetical protein [Pseudomonadota bacterium]
MDINDSSGYSQYLNMLGQSYASSVTTDSSDDDEENNTLSSLAASADTVSISSKAERLSDIAAEFFDGDFTSDDIAELTERLYEEGLISASDYSALGNTASTASTTSAISEAVHFLNSFIVNESVDGDSEAAKALTAVVDVLNNIDNSATSFTQQQEEDAYELVAGYTELLEEAGAPDDLLAGFNNVKDVLAALQTVRSSEQQTGALASYASVQEAYDDLLQSSQDS